MKIARWTLIILLVTPLGAISARQQQAPSPATQPQQQDSVAAAARHAREQKKDQPKPQKVWDNDSIPELGPVSVVGNEEKATTSPDGSPNAPEKQGQPATGEPQNDAAKKAQEDAAAMDSAKASLETLKNELDVLERKYSLDQQSYYGKPDYSSDKAGAAALQDEQSQIDAKQLEVDDAQKKLDDLQAQSPVEASSDTAK